MSATTEVIQALVTPKVVKPKMPKGPNCNLCWLAFTETPTLTLGSRFVATRPRVPGSDNQNRRPNQGRGCNYNSDPGSCSSSGSQRCRGPCEGPIEKAFICQCEDIQTGVAGVLTHCLEMGGVLRCVSTQSRGWGGRDIKYLIECEGKV